MAIQDEMYKAIEKEINHAPDRGNRRRADE